MTRNEAWQLELDAGHRLRPLEEKDYDLLLPFDELVVRRGMVTMKGGGYPLLRSLELYNGQTVRVAYDPADLSRVYLGTLDDKWIGIAERDSHSRPFLPEDRLASSRERAALSHLRRNNGDAIAAPAAPHPLLTSAPRERPAPATAAPAPPLPPHWREEPWFDRVIILGVATPLEEYAYRRAVWLSGLVHTGEPLTAEQEKWLAANPLSDFEHIVDFSAWREAAA
jgi:hypothetical protein